MPVQRTGTFRPNDIAVVITHEELGISHIVGGYSEDAIVSIERAVATNTLYTGADDTSTRVYNASTAGTVTLSLQQSSVSNDILSALYELDRASRSSRYMFTIMIKDNSGRSLYFADEAFIDNLPNSAFANSMQLREWVIHCPRLTQTIGGNAGVNAADVATLDSLGVTLDSKWV